MFSEYTMYLFIEIPLSLLWATSPTLWYQSPKLNPLYTAYSQVCRYTQYEFMVLSNSPQQGLQNYKIQIYFCPLVHI